MLLVSAILNNGLPTETNSPCSAYFSNTVPASGVFTKVWAIWSSICACWVRTPACWAVTPACCELIPSICAAIPLSCSANAAFWLAICSVVAASCLRSTSI